MNSQELYLSILDQTIVRSYIRVLLLFPFPDPYKYGAASKALESGLQSTLLQHPYLAGTIGPADAITGKIKAHYPERPSDVSTLGVFQTSFQPPCCSDLDFDSLKKRGMPQDALTSDIFCPMSLQDHPGIGCRAADSALELNNGPVPALAIQATFIRGGLVLSVYAHHSLLDGAGLGLFLQQYAVNVRNYKADAEVILNEASLHTASRRELDLMIPTWNGTLPSVDCPEFQILPGSTKEALPRNTLLRDYPYSMSSKIFVFSPVRLSILRDATSHASKKKLSAFTVLSALLWVCVTKSREPALLEVGMQDETTGLGIAVNLRRAAGPEFKDHIGNLAAATLTSIQIPKILAPPDHSTAISMESAMVEAATAIAATLSRLDRDWLLTRLAYLAAVPDPRRLGYSFSLVNSPNFFVNDWQAIGADTEWDIPGTTSSHPEFVRRPYSEGERGTFGIILPRRRLDGEQRNYEVLVRLADEDMARFEYEIAQWVERIVS